MRPLLWEEKLLCGQWSKKRNWTEVKYFLSGKIFNCCHTEMYCIAPRLTLRETTCICFIDYMWMWSTKFVHNKLLIHRLIMPIPSNQIRMLPIPTGNRFCFIPVMAVWSLPNNDRLRVWGHMSKLQPPSWKLRPGEAGSQDMLITLH